MAHASFDAFVRRRKRESTEYGKAFYDAMKWFPTHYLKPSPVGLNPKVYFARSAQLLVKHGFVEHVQTKQGKRNATNATEGG